MFLGLNQLAVIKKSQNKIVKSSIKKIIKKNLINHLTVL